MAATLASSASHAPCIPGRVERVPARLDERTAVLLTRGQQRTGCQDLAAALDSMRALPPFTKREKCLRFMSDEIHRVLRPYLLVLEKSKRQVLALVVMPARASQSGDTPAGQFCFEVSCVQAKESARYVPSQMTFLHITQHAAARLLERLGRADLQTALIDELGDSASNVRAVLSLLPALAEAFDDPDQGVFLLPTKTGHFVVTDTGVAVTWVSDTIAAAPVHRQVAFARQHGTVVKDLTANPPLAEAMLATKSRLLADLSPPPRPL